MSYQIRVVPRVAPTDTLQGQVFNDLPNPDVVTPGKLRFVGILSGGSDTDQNKVGFLVQSGSTNVPVLVSMSLSDFQAMASAITTLQWTKAL